MTDFGQVSLLTACVADQFFVAAITLFVIVATVVARLDISTGLGNLPHMQLLSPFKFLSIFFSSFTAEDEFNGLSKRQVCLRQ